MKQQAFRFGYSQEMVGILSYPDDLSLQKKQAVLTWNTGIAHRIGPHRIAVDISYSLARIGMVVFRFDLAGRGDSLPATDQAATALKNVQEAMDFLQKKFGMTEFILHGLCSGAVEAHEVARADTRVVGLSMVDTYAYPTRGFHWHYVLKRIRHPRMILNKLMRLFQGPKPLLAGEAPVDLFWVPFPPFGKVRADFEYFLKRKMPCLIIYTSGYEYVYNYHNQFYDMFRGIPVEKIVTLKRFVEADHLFTFLDQRRLFTETFCDWVLRHFVENERLNQSDLTSIEPASADFEEKTAG